ncbi:hypothetical protein O9929_19290 [Vibrio lentus]|nr:hypothetical protein [Vibrio lentus]
MVALLVPGLVKVRYCIFSIDDADGSEFGQDQKRLSSNCVQVNQHLIYINFIISSDFSVRTKDAVANWW